MRPPVYPYTAMCVICGDVHAQAAFEDACPACGDLIHKPLSVSDTVTVTLGRDELGTLARWAYRFAEADDQAPKPPLVTVSSVKVVTLILDRLALQTDVQLRPDQFWADAEVPDREGEA